MKDANDFNTTSEHFPVNENDDIWSFHGHLELVNFPSTSEIFEAVFENKYYASSIGNGNGETLKANERACNIFGYTPKEMCRLTVNNLFDTKTKDYADLLLSRDCEGKAKGIITGIRKNGERFPCEISSHIYINDNGEKRTLNTMQDLSKKYSIAF